MDFPTARKMSVAQLKQQLQQHGLPTLGDKNELLYRLLEVLYAAPQCRLSLWIVCQSSTVHQV